MRRNGFNLKIKRKCSNCGNTWNFNRWDLLKLLFKGKIYYHCLNCGAVQCYVMVYHCVHDNTDSFEKSYNKWLMDCKRNLFKRS